MAAVGRSHARLFARRLRTSAQHASAEARRLARREKAGRAQVLLVLGCQRSGTTLVTELLGRDEASKVYPEHSALSAGDRRHGLRLGRLDRIARKLARSRFPLIVLKPLVESQRAPALLDTLPRAQALWMFRAWRDVARSNIARFGPANGVKNLRSVARRDPQDWRSEAVSDAVHETVAAHFREDMSPWDAAALFWWARNQLFFELGLDTRDDLMSCSYEELVDDPGHVLGAIYRRLELPFPGRALAGEISRRSLGLGRSLEIHPEIEKACDELWERICATHVRRSPCALPS